MKKNNKGFTLAELLIVVAILGILVAVAIPTFRNSLDESNRNVTLNNLRAAYSQAVMEVTKRQAQNSSGTTASSSPYPAVCKVVITNGTIKVDDTDTALDALGLPFTGENTLATGATVPATISVCFEFTYNDAGVMESVECQLSGVNESESKYKIANLKGGDFVKYFDEVGSLTQASDADVMVKTDDGTKSANTHTSVTEGYKYYKLKTAYSSYSVAA